MKLIHPILPPLKSGLLLLAAVLGSAFGDVPLPPEFTVFGTNERTQLTNAAASDLIRLDRRSVLQEDFNYLSRFTYAVNLISPGTIIIEAGNPNLLYTAYNDRADIKTMEIMAKTVIIRSPLRLKQTALTIYARELRFEGAGQITTTPEEKTVRAPDATAEGVANKGQNGANGLPGGSVNVFVGSFVDGNSGVSPKFVLNGGKGQDAGRGQHGVKGADAANTWSSFTFNLDCGLGVKDSATYTPPAGYLGTYVSLDGVAQSGNAAWPGNGTNAWQPGTPGQGGNGGTFTANLSLSSSRLGGAAGLRGSAPANATSSSTTTCVGGANGYPQKSAHVDFNDDSEFFNPCDVNVGATALHESTVGSSYPVPTAGNGSTGGSGISGTSFSWLNPQLLRQILGKVKDDYLQNRITAAEAALRDYSLIIEQYRANAAAWNAASQTARFELSQIYDDMQILLQQIANGLDHFGNPNGWVPMLSFEVTLALFDQEISRSLDMVYLARWITRNQDNAAATVSALATARADLKTEIDEAKTSYDGAVAELDGLTGEAQALNLRVANLQNQLEAKDNELRAQAVANTQPSDWEVGLRVGLKVAGTICKMIPVYQPALGAAGGALDLAADFDPDEPWATVTGALDLTTAYADSAVLDAANAQKAQKNGVNTANLDTPSARVTNLQNLSQASSALSSGIKGVSSTLEATKASASEVEAELDKLRKANPAYNTLVTDITQLMKDKREFADKMTATIRKVAGLSDLITRNILAIDALSVTTGAQTNIIDARVTAYLKDMERRAFDRLLKYHYYMAKAYEYRLVRPYTATLDLQPLFNKIEEIATAGTPGGNLSGAQLELLKSVYRDLIATTTESIIDDYNSSPSIPGSSISIALTADEIASLNRGEAFNLNLFDRGTFLPNEENIRIVNLEVLPTNGMTTARVGGGAYGSPAYVDLCIEHSGISNMKMDGELLQFRHYNQSTRNAITWKSRYEPVSNSISPTPPVEAAGSLLRALVPALSSPQVLLYSRPSAWADLRVWRAGRNGATTFGIGDANAPINITGLTLRVTYDRSLRKATPNVRDFNVVAHQYDSLNARAVGEALAAAFTVSAVDRNGRQNAKGSFVRIFNYNTPATVQVTAPAVFGSLGFLKWTENGTDVGSDPTISRATTSDHQLIAYYVPLAPVVLPELVATAAEGMPFQYQIAASNNATSYNASGLPSGLDVNPTTGRISGTAAATGNFNVGLSATNTAGTGTATLVLNVVGRPEITSPLTASGPQGSVFSYQIAATVAGTSFTASGLPLGLQVNPTTGVISGTPTQNGVFNISLGAVTALGTATGTLALTIGPSSINLTAALDDPYLIWATGGTGTWHGQTGTKHDGDSAARSSGIGDLQQTYLETTVTGSGTLTFWWKVSSEGGYDFLRFYLDGSEIPAVPAISGEVDWVQVSIPIPTGVHTLKWAYSKDSSDSSGADAGWVDGVSYVSPGFVTNTTDNDPGSLRQAIANVAEGETITFARALGGQTITLTGGVLTLSKNVTIDASALAGGIRLDANHASQIFTLGGGVTVALKSLTMINGHSDASSWGGAIHNDGTLALTHCTLADHTVDAGSNGGAIHSSGSLTLTGCVLSGNTSGGRGGAIMSNGGFVTLTNCTLTGNTSAGIGGAINNEGSTLTLTNSTLTGNTSLGSTESAQGGAIFNFDVPLTLIHCTLTGNTATGNGGAIRTQAGTATIHNTIIAGNTSGNGPDIGSGGTTFNIAGANLIGDNATVSGQFPAGPLVGTTAAPRNPRLAPLGDFGGPTRTMPPLPGSPAINAAVLLAGTPATDQRGNARPAGPLPDLGAVEAFAFSNLAPIDTDRDGIDDRLEPSYGLVVGTDDRAADSDGDGSLDRHEIANLTNPLNPADHLRILSFAKAAGFDPGTNRVFDITIKTVPGLRYFLEKSSTLETWEVIANSEFTAAANTHPVQLEMLGASNFVRCGRVDSRRWASKVLGFSSEYSEDAWSAAQALGEPNTYPAYGDIATAWASAGSDSSPEYLELGFDNPAPISAVAIYETLAPGAVTKVSVRNATNSQWVQVWIGAAAPAPAAARIFTVSFPVTAFPVDGVRLDLDSQAVPDWNEIDAVCIIRADP
jgi:hypothetical protein